MWGMGTFLGVLRVCVWERHILSVYRVCVKAHSICVCVCGMGTFPKCFVCVCVLFVGKAHSSTFSPICEWERHILSEFCV